MCLGPGISRRRSSDLLATSSDRPRTSSARAAAAACAPGRARPANGLWRSREAFNAEKSTIAFMPLTGGTERVKQRHARLDTATPSWSSRRAAVHDDPLAPLLGAGR